MTTYRGLFLFFYLLIFLDSTAQSLDSAYSIKVIAKVKDSEITLRWAPSNATAWQLVNKYGYMVERWTMVRNQKVLKSPAVRKITEEPIKPAPLEAWEKYAKSDKYSAIAAQALYGNNFEVQPTNTGIVQIVNKSRELETRFSFALFCADQSLDAANLSGLKLTDKYVFKSERYLYKIYTNVPSSICKIDTGYVFIDASQFSELPAPSDLSILFGDRTASVTWSNIYQDTYSSYAIERSDDGGKTFNEIKPLPFINTTNSPTKVGFTTFVDSIPQNNILYTYRVRGKSYFAEFGKYSETLSGKGFKKSKSVPIISSMWIDKNQEVNISWVFNDTINIQSIQLLTAPSLKQSWKDSGKKVDKNSKNVIVKQLSNTQYYSILLTDNDKNEYQSLPKLVQLIDTLPPSKPTNLTAVFDTNGRVSLAWKNNTEEDLLGYRVYFANSEIEEFSQITKAPSTENKWSEMMELNTISKFIYFKIVALDLRYNVSVFSETLKVPRPDKIAPTSPYFLEYKADTSAIKIRFSKSPDDDIAKHTLLRKSLGESDWKVVFEDTTHKSRIVEWTDTKAIKDTIYSYRLLAIDKSGNSSTAPQNLQGKRINAFSSPASISLFANADRENGTILLNWNNPEKMPIKLVMIYKAYPNQGLRLYKTLPENVSAFKDTNTTINTQYKYAVKLEFQNGSYTQLSNEVKVLY